MSSKEINIIGGGCAAFSLARFNNLLPQYKFNLFLKDQHQPIKDHCWGFWKFKENQEAYDNSYCSWNNWAIITSNSKNILSSKKHPYCVIKRQKWLNFCLSKLQNKQVNLFNRKILEDNEELFDGNYKLNGDYIFDSRPPKMPSNILLQHFEGYVVNSKDEIFDDKTVILMDFRCDQSKGMHFIYLLPFSKKTALVESTMFSKHLESNNFYDKAILKYLKKYYNLKSFTKSNHEKGIIPMHDVSLMSKNRFNIGTRGGAVRPSTGYAFTFIQKQVLQIKDQLISGKKINTNIHSKIDLFLDKIFIRVIDKYPEIAPTIFSNLAKNINGDEMARFMSGNCDFKTNWKIVFSMPKIPFIISFFKIISQ